MAKQDEECRESQDPLLSEEFAELKGDINPSRRTFTTTKYLLIFGVMTILLFASILSVFSYTRRVSENKLSRPEPPDHTFCGRTPAEAVKNGCHFEPMLSSWVPEACYFTDEGDYDVFDDLPWYSDPFLRQPLNTTEMMNVRAGNYGHVYTTWAYHDEHCLYTWRKLAMAMEKRLPMVDTKTADEEHSQHCARVTRNYVREDGQEKIADLKTLGLKVTLTYFGCVNLF
ncbi:uncharacterized protein EAF02_008231 [Botrytis sinoallii]|uniref:uncharacterized protein n=1 Tax=Botrytis sinoallii TaxID=1463999 RepID=UPI001900DB4C|nr:uncharacterized protein EAF02_008231 [Botrytis sinoallii]KAF7877011.1 hypothetical protein EAF02_008231 [Botrytis sinoallii]